MKKAEGRFSCFQLEAREPSLCFRIDQIRNNVNGRVFVRSSPNLRGKENSDKFQLQMGSHLNRELQKEWNEYGGESFSFEVLEYLEYEDENAFHDTKHDLKALEEKWLDKLQPYEDKGYNRKRTEK